MLSRADEKLDVSLLLALVLQTATSWRLDAWPLSIGEIFGALYIAKVFNRHSRGMNRFWSVELSLLYSAFVLIPLIGSSYRALFGTPGFYSEIDLADGIRNFFAMLYVGMLCGAQMLDVQTRWETVWRTIVISIGTTALLHLVSIPLWWFGIVPTIWHAGEMDNSSVTDLVDGNLLRFVGFSLNPNQLGMVIAGAFFVLMSRRAELTPALRAFLLVLLCLIGLLIRSNTVFLAWAAGIGIVAFSRIRRGKPIVLVVVMMVLLAYASMTESILIRSIVDKGPDSDANGRFPLWASAVDAIAYSPLWGYGFGTHSGESAPFQAMEAHNTFLDLSLQGGLVSGVLLLILFYRSFRAALILGDGPIIASVVACFVEQLSHNALRTPFFWTVVLMPLSMLKHQHILDQDGQGKN